MLGPCMSLRGQKLLLLQKEKAAGESNPETKVWIAGSNSTVPQSKVTIKNVSLIWAQEQLSCVPRKCFGLLGLTEGKLSTSISMVIVCTYVVVFIALPSFSKLKSITAILLLWFSPTNICMCYCLLSLNLVLQPSSHCRDSREGFYSAASVLCFTDPKNLQRQICPVQREEGKGTSQLCIPEIAILYSPIATGALSNLSMILSATFNSNITELRNS